MIGIKYRFTCRIKSDFIKDTVQYVMSTCSDIVNIVQLPQCGGQKECMRNTINLLTVLKVFLSGSKKKTFQVTED